MKKATQSHTEKHSRIAFDKSMFRHDMVGAKIVNMKAMIPFSCLRGSALNHTFSKKQMHGPNNSPDRKSVV